jgi:DNA-binding NarL/FixJ family response regulator
VNGFKRSLAARAPIVIVDPDAAQRDFAERLLRRSGWRTEAYATGEEALAAARRERPLLVLIEVRLGDTSGYEVCQELQDECGPGTGIIFTSGDRTDRSDKVAGLMLGADDYLTKPLEGSELVARVHAVVRRLPSAQADGRAARDTLTPRELEVLQLLAGGLDQPAIAKQLVITPKTVGKHIEHILKKLPARSRAEAVTIAFQRQLYRRRPAP